jgi:sn-glycerol 3-phosphate transport system substrate-binding protein
MTRTRVRISHAQMLFKPPLPFTKGLRLGNMPQIRTIVDEELESVWTGKKTPSRRWIRR